MKKKKLVIIGAGITATRIYNFIQQNNLFDVIGFAQDKAFIKQDTFHNLPIYDIRTLDATVKIFVAFGWNRLNKERKDLFIRLKQEGFRFANIISPSSKIYGKIIGENCWITDNVVIESGAILESNVIADHNAYIGTNTIIKSHCYIGAKSLIAGGCEIGEQSFIGLNSTIFDQTTIGDKCLIGACTIVKRNLNDFSIIKTKSDTNVIKSSNAVDIENKLLYSKNVR